MKSKKINYKISWILIISVILGMLFLSSCNLGSNDTGIHTNSFFGGEESSSTSKLNGNSNGILIKFNDGNPPSEVYKDQDLTFAFIIENYLESDVNDLTIKASGFDKSLVQGLDNLINGVKIQTIPKATKDGGKTIYSGFIVKNVKVNGFIKKYNFNTKFDYCYTGKSLYFEQICIPSIKDNKCDLKYSQDKYINGPVQLTIKKIININSNKIRLIFNVHNNGNGQVVNQCFNTKDYSNAFSVNLKLGTEVGDCKTPNGKIELNNGQSILICDFTRSGSEDSYITQVSGDLTYKYQQSIEKNIVVNSIE